MARVRVARDDLPSARLLEIQRSRLVAGAVGAIEELGYAQTTISHITARARISRRTFYELFANREECLAAVLDDVAGLVGVELAAAGLEDLEWRERIRMGLWTILSFFDREPVLARVCVVQALRANPGLLGRREEILARLAAIVDEGRAEGTRGGWCTTLTAEGLVGAVFAVVYARLLRADRRPLTDLLGELMGLIVLPYLGSSAARREQARSAPASPPAARRVRAGAQRSAKDPFEGVQMRLTYRTARVLESVAELGGRGPVGARGLSNRQVADAAGVSDPGQISKLLRRLERLGLLTNAGESRAAGEPNAWVLTGKGERVAQSIRVHRCYESEAA